jgi:hypothetical protein
MAKLDRLGWAAGLCFISYGARIGIRVNDPAALERIASHLPPRWKPAASPIVKQLCSLHLGGSTTSPGVRRYNLLYWGVSRIARTLDRDEVFQALESLLHLVVSTQATDKVFVQAGVVGWGGRAIVISGPPCSGKTTLVGALVRAGATYYSDLYAVFDAQGRVHPYPTPLNFQEGEGQTKRYAVETFGGQLGTKPLPVGLVLVAPYHSGAQWRPRVLSSGQAVLTLLADTVPARLRPRLALASLRCVVASAAILKGKRGEADAMVQSVLDHVGGRNGEGRLLSTGKA